jgi:hypothetical protein
MLRRSSGELADEPELRHQGRHEQREENASEELLRDERDHAEDEPSGTREVQARTSPDSDGGER